MKKNRTSLIVTLLLLITILVGCTKPIQYEDYAGIFTLESAILDDLDITDEYHMYQIELLEDQSMMVMINYLGILTSRQSSYQIKYPYVIETYNRTNYQYEFIEDDHKLTYEETENNQTLIVTLVRQVEVEDEEIAVDFESILFGEDLLLTKKFNYAPSIIYEQDEHGLDIMHIWYCTNVNSGIIVDNIGYRKGIKNSEGLWVFSEEQIVLSPTP